jgi:hypothetical protein
VPVVLSRLFGCATCWQLTSHARILLLPSSIHEAVPSGISTLGHILMNPLEQVLALGVVLRHLVWKSPFSCTRTHS